MACETQLFIRVKGLIRDLPYFGELNTDSRAKPRSQFHSRVTHHVLLLI